MRQARWERQREYLRGTLWVIPVLFVIGAAILGAVLSLVDIRPGSPLDPVLFQGSADEARRLLLSIATTVVGVVALVIGLTVVALQVAANRYSPRLLRNFLRDRSAQVVLGIFGATFTYNAAGLFTVGVRSGTRATGDYPRLAVTIGLGLVFVSVGAFLYFVDHMVHSIQIDAVLARTGKANAAVIAQQPPGIGRTSGQTDFAPGSYVEPPAWAVALPSRRSGYVQTAHPELIVGAATAHDVTVRLVPMVGDHVVAGTPLAWVWRTSPEQQPPPLEPLQKALADAVTIGFERTMQQDADLGVSQIVDIAMLSLHIKDFYTVVQAINELSILLCKLARHPLGTETVPDAAGTVRVVVPALPFEEYLTVACGLIRRFGASEPMVARALLRMLGDVGTLVTTDERRVAVAEQVRLVLAGAERGIPDAADLARVQAEAQKALAVSRPQGLKA